ncbi:TPA: hypothetical protein I8Y21_004792 [Klebsiella oxytoca]|uniref:Uncharacterized protein n=1 Tax=Klebsiella oxytoca TaxID=571 RepID=A0AAN5LBP6_KLEOX|nr:hypothetical protein [Klebsiella oxytoca]
MVEFIPETGAECRIYAALEYRIRKGLAEQERDVPDMKKKPTRKPTARWSFLCFIGIHPTFRTNISNNLIFQHLYMFHAYVKYQLKQMVMNYVRNVGYTSTALPVLHHR